MPDFTPRDFDQILVDMVAHIENYSQFSDFSDGSSIKTILEAAALEDSEAYFQMTQILEVMSIYTAQGEKLDRRLADFDIEREIAKGSTGRGIFFDSSLVMDMVSADGDVGTASLYLFDSSIFPVSDYPYTIRIAEGTTRVQDVAVSFNDTVSHALSLGTSLQYSVVVGDRVALVTGSVARTINSGYQVACPATASSVAKVYTSTEQAFIDAGNYFSNEVVLRATSVGVETNVSARKVSQFLGAPPFNGAGVVSTTAMAGGREQERDEDFLARGIDQIRSLSRGTRTALKSAAKGVQDGTTGQRVLSANVIEDFVNDEVFVYIDDGSGFTPDYGSYAISTLADDAVGMSITLVDGSQFASTGYIFLSGAGQNTVLGYSDRVGNTLSLTGSADSYLAGAEVSQVEFVANLTEPEQRRFRLNHSPVARGTEIIWALPARETQSYQLTRDLDYAINEGTGDFALTTPLPPESALFANYTYSINLVASVQKVLEGDPNDEVNFPGVKAAGIHLLVLAPAIRRISVRVAISAADGFSEQDLYEPVRTQIEQYISSLPIGGDVIVSRIIDAAHNVQGVYAVRVIEPTQNQTILENQLPIPFDAAGNSLVSVA